MMQRILGDNCSLKVQMYLIEKYNDDGDVQHNFITCHSESNNILSFYSYFQSKGDTFLRHQV